MQRTKLTITSLSLPPSPPVPPFIPHSLQSFLPLFRRFLLSQRKIFCKVSITSDENSVHCKSLKLNEIDVVNWFGISRKFYCGLFSCWFTGCVLIPFFKYCERCFLERNLFSVGVIFVQFNYSAQKTKRNLYPSLRVLLSIDELDLGSNANRTDPPSFCSSLAYCYVQLICSAHFSC